MSSIVKATVLGLGLVAGAAFAAQAQNAGAVSALPPGGPSSAGPSVVAPSGPYPGPAAGAGTAPTGKLYSQVMPSGKYPGPALGESTGAVPPHFVKPPGYDQNPDNAPYTTPGMGPKPN